VRCPIGYAVSSELAKEKPKKEGGAREGKMGGIGDETEYIKYT